MKNSTKIIAIFISFWIAIAVFRTLYNFSKLATEEREWYSLSSDEQREKDFGDAHNFFRFVQTRTKTGSNILFYSKDTKAYFLGRYYLYPTKVIWGEYQHELWGDKIARDYDFLMIYPVNEIESEITNDKITYTLSSIYNEKSTPKGAIYKK